MAIKKGDKVKIEYTGKLDDGSVFDATEKHGQALEFEVGAGKVIKGFDDAVTGMEKGQEKEFRIEAKDAYGERNDALLKKVPRDKLPQDQEPKQGMMLALSSPDGRQFPAKITKVEEKEITIDLNHPLAGQALNFKIKVVDVS